MLTNSIKSEGFNLTATSRPLVAQRQLQTSIGAVVMIAVVAVAAAVSVRASAPVPGTQVAKALVAPIVVKTVARVVPSERLQAVDQTRADRRS